MAEARARAIASHISASLQADGPRSAAVAPQASSCTIPAGGRPPVKVLVTGAAGNIAYVIAFMIGQGRMLGPDQPIELRLLDIPGMEQKMDGLMMEIADCALPLISSVITTTDYKTAFQDVEVALLIGARPRGPDMDRKDLLAANGKIFSGQGKALNSYANRNVKVLVVGNPANTNALIAMTNAPNIPRENFSALTRLDQNRAVGFLAQRLQVPVQRIKNVIIWGNHSNTQYPDVSHAYIEGDGRDVRSAVGDDSWIRGEYIKLVALRGGAVIKARGSSSAASAANAAVDHMRCWLLGTEPGEFVSMAVCSDGSYDVPKGLIYSFPVFCCRGNYKIVQGLKIDEFSRKKMQETARELEEEKAMALSQ